MDPGPFLQGTLWLWKLNCLCPLSSWSMFVLRPKLCQTRSMDYASSGSPKAKSWLSGLITVLTPNASRHLKWKSLQMARSSAGLIPRTPFLPHMFIHLWTRRLAVCTEFERWTTGEDLARTHCLRGIQRSTRAGSTPVAFITRSWILLYSVNSFL